LNASGLVLTTSVSEMNRLYKLTGTVTKTKSVDTIYVIAPTAAQAQADAEAFATAVTVVSSEKLSEEWN